VVSWRLLSERRSGNAGSRKSSTPTYEFLRDHPWGRRGGGGAPSGFLGALWAFPWVLPSVNGTGVGVVGVGIGVNGAVWAGVVVAAGVVTGVVARLW